MAISKQMSPPCPPTKFSNLAPRNAELLQVTMSYFWHLAPAPKALDVYANPWIISILSNRYIYKAPTRMLLYVMSLFLVRSDGSTRGLYNLFAAGCYGITTPLLFPLTVDILVPWLGGLYFCQGRQRQKNS